MFKKFNPKDDVANSTSLKSSAQRNIRAAWLEQTPFLSLPAWSEEGSTSASGSGSGSASAPIESREPCAEQEGTAEDGVNEEEEQSGKKSGKGGKGKKDKDGNGKGGGKKGKGKGSKGDEEENKESTDAQTQTQLVIDQIWPKKDPLGITKCHERISIYTLDSTPLIFQHFDGPLVPTMKLLHRYPDMLAKVRIDAGAIKFLLAGANMMAPGLLSAGGDLPPNLSAGQLVAIHAQGKQHACGIGRLTASSEEIKKAGKGVAVEVLTYIGDDLWKIDKL